MTIDQGLLERVQELKETNGIGTLQALRQIKIENKYEPLRVSVEAQLREKLSDMRISLEDVMEACSVMYRGWAILESDELGPLEEYHESNEDMQSLYSLFAKVYIPLKNAVLEKGENVHEFQLYGKVQKLTRQAFQLPIKKYEINDQQILFFNRLSAEPQFDEINLSEGELSLYARAALDGTLQLSATERKIALSFIKRNTSNHFLANNRIRYSIQMIKSLSGPSIQMIKSLSGPSDNASIADKPDALIYKLRTLEKDTDKEAKHNARLFAENNEFIISERVRTHGSLFVKYITKQDQYTLRAIEENVEWLKKVLS
jgi:hypothetical protein